MTKITDLLERGNKLVERLNSLKGHRNDVARIATAIRYDESVHSPGQDAHMIGLDVSIVRRDWHRQDLRAEYLPSKQHLIGAYIINLDAAISTIEKELDALIPPAPEPEERKLGRKKRK